MYINFCQDKTLEPTTTTSASSSTPWAAIKFNLDVPKYLVTAAVTVEKLAKGQLKRLSSSSPNRITSTQMYSALMTVAPAYYERNCSEH